MSRCFPFPPPGYENKARNDHVDLLAKEKHREKKHKKEKRDKEKREGKERRDKDKNKDKNKEKKDRKEKHKDKKKDKEVDNEKNKASDDRRIEGRTEGHEKKLGDSSQKVEEVQEFTEEFDRRIRNGEKGAAHPLFETFTGSTQRRADGFGTAIAIEKERSNGNEIVGVLVSREQRRNNGMVKPAEKDTNKKFEGKEKAEHKETDDRKGDRNREGKDAIFTEELDRRIRGEGAAHKMLDNFSGSIKRKAEDFGTAMAIDKEQSSGNEMVGVLVSRDQRRKDGMRRPVEKDANEKIERKEKAKQKETNERNGNGHREVKDSKITEGLDRRIRDEVAAHTMFDNFTGSIQRRAEGLGTAIASEKEPSNGNKLVGVLASREQRRNDGMGRPVEKGAERNIEGKDKAKEKGNNDEKGDNHRDRDREEKRNRGKDSSGHKEKEKGKEKVRKKDEHKHKENDTPKEIGKKDQVVGLNFKPLAPHKDNEKCVGSDENMKKRKKGFEVNGSLHDDVRPNKVPRPAPSSHPHVENGRTLESCHISTTRSSIEHVSKNNIKAERVMDDDKEHKINGTAGAQQSSVHSRPSVVENGEAPLKRPPHPDSKHLSLIYTVPKMEEWPESDEQEWLFSSDHPRLKPNPKTEAEETPQVWAEALRIESEDVSALPYVIPY